MKLGKRIWTEDDATHGLPGHVTIGEKWRELFNEPFDVKDAEAREDRGDHFHYLMKKAIAVLDYDGWAIYDFGCGTCGGVGSVDSGGVTPWSGPINIPCPECGKPEGVAP
jgi:hypothetical protein